MKHYRPSSELQRVAEEAARNELRHRAWKARIDRQQSNRRRGGTSAGEPRPAAENGAFSFPGDARVSRGRVMP